MAEQFPEEGGKIPRLGLEDAKQTWAPPWAPSGERQGSWPSLSLPPSPDRTGVSLGFFAPPPHLPKPWSTFPWHPHSHQSLLSFPSGTPIFLLNAPAVPPSRKPPPLLLHQIPTCPLAPSQFTVGTADVTLLLGAHNLGPKLPGILVLGSPCPGTRGALVLETGGCL